MGCLILREVSSDPLSPCNRDPDCMQFVEYCNSDISRYRYLLPGQKALLHGCLILREVSSDPLSPCNRDPDCMQFVEYCNSKSLKYRYLFEPPPLDHPIRGQSWVIEYVLGLQQTASRHQNRCQLRQEIILGGAFIASVIIWTLLCCLCRCICCGNRSTMIGSAPAGRKEVVMVKV